MVFGAPRVVFYMQFCDSSATFQKYCLPVKAVPWSADAQAVHAEVPAHFKGCMDWLAALTSTAAAFVTTMIHHVHTPKPTATLLDYSGRIISYFFPFYPISTLCITDDRNMAGAAHVYRCTLFPELIQKLTAAFSCFSGGVRFWVFL